MSAHTPGPWRVGGMGYVIDSNEDIVADTMENKKPIEEQDANARLIGAAPTMLKALKVAQPYILGIHSNLKMAMGHPDTAVRPDLELIDGAIAKAEGRE